MINFFKNIEKEKVNDSESFTKIAALLIHTAKIDEMYTEKETEIIKKTLIELGAHKPDIDKIIIDATIIEKNSNQILNFTKEIKTMDDSDKIKIIKSLWKIIYSDDKSDMYETNLMRRIAGLLYIEDKIMGDIKEEMRNNLSK